MFENTLATVTPLSNLVMVGMGASRMYDGRLVLLLLEDATVAAAAVDIFIATAADADDDDDDADGWVAAAARIRRLASWSMMTTTMMIR